MPPAATPLQPVDGVEMEAPGVMRMGGTMVCVQRCFGDAWLRGRNADAQRSELVASCFHGDLDEPTRQAYALSKSDMLQDESWDFLVLVMDVAMTTILATCLVEYRREKGKDSQLYICDLCTQGGYAHLGLGTQMIQGVRWLGCLIRSGRTAWTERARALYLTLTVKKGDDAHGHVSRMYRRCGFAEAARGGSLDYPNNNRFIPYGFMFEEGADHTPMCSLVEPDVAYREAGIGGGGELVIYAAWSTRGKVYYHEIADDVDEVRRYGLMNPQQRVRILNKRGDAAADPRWYTAMGAFFVRGDAPSRSFSIRADGDDDRVVSHGLISPHLGVVNV